MTVRKAILDDISAIAPLYRILFKEMAELQPAFWRPAEMPRTFILELIEGKHSDILVAEEEGVVVGFAVVQDRDTLPFNPIIPNRYAYLMDMVVDPAHRGKGLGSALLAAVDNWAKERGCRWVELNVLEENTAARRLYERAGLSCGQRTMRKML